MSLAVNVVRNIPKIQSNTDGDLFQVRFSQSDEKMWWKCCHGNFTNIWNPLTCWLWKGVLKRYFLESGINKSFTVCNFRNRVAMTIIFFLRMNKIWCRFQKSKKKNEKKLFVLKINAFESGTANSHNPEQDTCHWRSMCYETALRFHI